jgi:cytochrome c oxidase cbb3-type subunit 1
MSQPQASRSLSTVAPVEIDGSCRVPLLLLFFSAGCWLLAGSAFALIASIKFHSPGFLADPAWLTYGRVRPAYVNCALYGFCIQAGLGVGLWMLARLGRTTLAQSGLVVIGTLVWNVGLALGILGILAGDSTGFESLEMPGYAAWVLLVAYLPIGVSGGLTFHQRREREVYVSQWFILAALFWFPWIYSTAELLLVTFPVRGAAQVAIWGYYDANMGVTWLTLVGLAALFYFIPKLTRHDLHSRYSALLVFWLVILFIGCVGIANSAPLPVWMSALSTVATMVMAAPIVTVIVILHQTLGGKWSKLAACPPLQFMAAGLLALVVVWLARIICAGIDVSYPVGLTWLTVAQAQLNSYGFFCLVMFGAAYAILPWLTRSELPFPALVRAHFWFALLGVLLSVVPLAIGGMGEARRLHDPSIPFMAVVKSTLPFLRVSTVGDLLLALGHLLFLVNVAGLAVRFYRPRAAAALAAATADLSTVEVKR